MPVSGLQRRWRLKYDFSDAGGAGEQNIFVAGDKGTTDQIGVEAAVKAGRGGEIKAGQGFSGFTAGLFEASLQGLTGASFQFIIKQENQEFGGAEFLGGRLFGPGIKGVGHPAQFELS